jgi:hypothetical protein
MAEDDVRDTAASEGQAAVYDQAAPAPGETRLPVDEQTVLPGEAPTRPSATDQSVEAARPGAGLGIESAAPGHAAEASPAKSAQVVSTQGQDTQTGPHSTEAAASSNGGSLLPADMDATFQQRWKEIQTRFVDEPRGAVEDADSLVANLMQQLADGFAKERERLEAQWGRGEDISTEDLRVALQRYRTFFQRLLST